MAPAAFFPMEFRYLRDFATAFLAAASLFAAGEARAQAPEVRSALYTVVDGYKVDPNTMNGFRAWRAAACDRCHGASQQGLVGPSLIESFKTLTKDDFVKTITNGRLDKGMPSFSGSPTVMQYKDALYAYLKGRSNGDITRAKVEEMKTP
jgi:mono/diheme cytochrome c family protein